jgi:hypothetical protein
MNHLHNPSDQDFHTQQLPVMAVAPLPLKQVPRKLSVTQSTSYSFQVVALNCTFLLNVLHLPKYNANALPPNASQKLTVHYICMYSVLLGVLLNVSLLTEILFLYCNKSSKVNNSSTNKHLYEN